MARALNKRKIPATPAVAAARGKTAIAVAPSDENTGMQARLIEAQAAMERDYARLREFESRYHHLFSATTESLLVVDAQTLRVLDANPAACSLLGVSSPKLVGGALTSVFHARAQTAIEVMAAEMLRGGQPGHLRAELLTGAKRVLLTASLFRQDGAFVLLLRLEAPDERAGRNAHTQASDNWAQYCAQAPDAVVLTDMAGRSCRQTQPASNSFRCPPSGRFAEKRSAAGSALVLALRAALTKASWPWIALALAASGVAHAIDLRMRLRRRP